jgi:carbon monoxide dehydrogenase subunit G
MRVRAEIDIQAPQKAVWEIVTDIGNAAGRITAIEKIEILERPKDKFVGLKWRETRTMFGKTATEVMWITKAKAPESYETRAESHGSIYTSRLSLSPKDGGTHLSMEFIGQPVALSAKIMWGLMGFMFKGATRKALAKDLEDIKKAAESNGKRR